MFLIGGEEEHRAENTKAFTLGKERKSEKKCRKISAVEIRIQKSQSEIRKLKKNRKIVWGSNLSILTICGRQQFA